MTIDDLLTVDPDKWRHANYDEPVPYNKFEHILYDFVQEWAAEKALQYVAANAGGLFRGLVSDHGVNEGRG